MNLCDNRKTNQVSNPTLDGKICRIVGGGGRGGEAMKLDLGEEMRSQQTSTHNRIGVHPLVNPTCRQGIPTGPQTRIPPIIFAGDVGAKRKPGPRYLGIQQLIRDEVIVVKSHPYIPVEFETSHIHMCNISEAHIYVV